jgi:hypothetical protein
MIDTAGLTIFFSRWASFSGVVLAREDGEGEEDMIESGVCW